MMPTTPALPSQMLPTAIDYRDTAVDVVHYAPGDCALLIGPAEVLLGRVDVMRAAGLRPAMLCTRPGDAARLPSGLRALAGKPAVIAGWMGQFTASVLTLGEPADLAPLSFHADGHFDWILDFTGTTLSDREVPPPGYFRLSADDTVAVKAALTEIAKCLRAGYRKPRYFRFDATRCAHQRHGFSGCGACIEACAATAIVGGKESIFIEPHLCQGCGACATVCPSSAVRYALPDTLLQLIRLQDALAAGDQSGDSSPGLWIGPGREDAPSGWLAWPVSAVASLGVDFWLVALALGCARIAISMASEHESSRTALAGQIDLGRSLLSGLGYPPALHRADDSAALLDIPVLSGLPRLPLPESDDKRTLLFAALDHLVAHGNAVPHAIDLSVVGAPVGEVSFDKGRCTLCGTCVNICPSGALTFPAADRITFVEARCLQCGLCANVCPERAVAMTPRLLTDHMARNAPRLVAQAEMFTCDDCGQAFAPRAMVERSRVMMAGHPMFEGDRARLMDLCPVCRQRAIAMA